MEWSAYLRGITPPLIHSHRISQSTSFPLGDVAIEEALARKPQAILIGYPYYRRPDRLVYHPAITAHIRKRFYSLAQISTALRLVDFGDIQLEEGDEGAPLEVVATELLQRGHRVIVFGGGQEAVLPLYKALTAQETPFIYALIDKKLDLIDPIGPTEMPTRLHQRQLLESGFWPTYLHLLGLAWHWLSPAEEDFLHTVLRAPYLRLHQLYDDADQAEPLLRTARLICIDGGIIRAADAPATFDPEPEGLTIEMAAKLMRFAGKGYYPDVLHLANYWPRRYGIPQTAFAFALLLWYFLEGLLNPEEDFPKADRSNLEAYNVSTDEPLCPTLTFYRHPVSGRWWLALQAPEAGPSFLFPCHESAYHHTITYREPPSLWYMLQQIGLP